MTAGIGKKIAVIGAGPAGLFATECLLRNGFTVSLFDQMPSAGCKFLTAGSHGGLNITNAAPVKEFASRYGKNQTRFGEYFLDFSSIDMQAWLTGLGVQTFTGSGGKIFPESMSTSQILFLWMERLREFSGFSFFPEHRLSYIENNTLSFTHAGKTVELKPSAVLFALGGASWPATGSDGRWAQLLAGQGIALEDFESANCGFEADWSLYLTERFTNIPLKNISMAVGETWQRGELMLTPYGIEGSLVYGFGPLIRKDIAEQGSCTFFLDLMPDWSIERIAERLEAGPGKESLSNFLRKKLNLGKIHFALLKENTHTENLKNPEYCAQRIKRLPLTVYRSRPIEEAISTAGGVSFAGLDDNLMLIKHPGWFFAGEMLDWESPTGGFLLQGCFSTAYRAAQGVARFLTN